MSAEQTKRDINASIALWMFSRLVMAIGTVAFLLYHRLPLSLLPGYALQVSQIHDDSAWYAFIAQEGYIKQDTVFFPMYPLLVHILYKFGLSVSAAGLFVSNAAMILDIFVMLRLFRIYVGEKQARVAVALFALFPMALFLSSMYTESLFVLFCCGSLLLLRNGHYKTAALVAALATLTRNTGILLLIPFAFSAYRHYKEFKRVPWHIVTPGLMIPGAIMGYCVYLWCKFGSPFLWSHFQQLWGREFMFPLLTLINGFGMFPKLWETNLWYGHIYYTVEILSVVLALAVVPVVWRALPREWCYLYLAMIAVPLCDPGIGVASMVKHPHQLHDYFFSFPRFLITMFPMFPALAVVVTRFKRISLLAISTSATGLGSLMVLINGHYFLA